MTCNTKELERMKEFVDRFNSMNEEEKRALRKAEREASESLMKELIEQKKGGVFSVCYQTQKPSN